MRIFKFGGASVKDAEAIKNVAEIISRFTDRPLIVIVSAMAKTTNALEEVVKAWVNRTGDAEHLFLEKVIAFHQPIVNQLFDRIPEQLSTFISDLIVEVSTLVNEEPPANYGQAYDAIVHKGELLSTRIINEYLLSIGQQSIWTDTRELVITNNSHRRATVNWVDTSAHIKAAIIEPSIYLVQGFIGSTKEGVPTTLGREGSDYTASVFAKILGADEVTIWKDVPGVLNGDPKVFNNTTLLEEISYREAIELAYYGASVIHPKTIQPLQESGIPLYVKSFLNPDEKGTVIGKGLLLSPLVSCFILKTNQALLTISTRDLAFIVEEHLQLIYSIFHQHGLTVNTMQNSAISSSFCVNNDPNILPKVLYELNHHFDVKMNTDVELYTIRHHSQQTIEAIKGNSQALLEQVTRETYQVVLKN